MWNVLLSGLLMSSAIVLYDGSPNHPGPETLWRIAAESGATCFGASPTYLQMIERAGIAPREVSDLSKLQLIFITGSPTGPDVFRWVYENVSKDLWVTSQSGGTEWGTALLGCVPGLPVYAGEIQARTLGMDVHVWDDDGREVFDEVGELVVTKPAPSMPLYFWNDPNWHRYRESYFEKFPGVWTHGDRTKINSRGGAYIYGRSDATLNRHGIRIGSSEIYGVVERIPGIADSLIVCIELPDGGFYMPLFVAMKLGEQLSDATIAAIVATLRTECSPRHVPDEVLAVPAIPYTLTGKKMEVPVRKILLGVAPDTAAGRQSMRDPAALDWFVRFAEQRRASKAQRSS